MQLTPLAVFDLDGTIRYSVSGGFIDGPDDIALFPDVEDALWDLREAGYMIFGVSNQGGAAFGHKTYAQMIDEIRITRDLFENNPFHHVFVSPYHEKGTVEPYNRRSLLRKPQIGMLVLVEQWLHKRDMHPDWNASFMVGDRDEDRELARRAEIGFRWAHEYFERETT